MRPGRGPPACCIGAAEAGGGHLRLIKGSHIVVKRIFEHDNAYIFQHPMGASCLPFRMSATSR
jgi:glycerol-3-phosphate dehydrogenase